MAKYVMGDFITTGENLYDLRVNQMQPSMVDFPTQDNVERQLIAEISNLNYGNDDFYYAGDESENAMPEVSSTNVVKKSIEEMMASGIVDQKAVKTLVSEGETIKDIPASSEASSIDMVKPSIAEAAAQAQQQKEAAKPANKALVYGGTAAIAAFLFFGGE